MNILSTYVANQVAGGGNYTEIFIIMDGDSQEIDQLLSAIKQKPCTLGQFAALVQTSKISNNEILGLGVGKWTPTKPDTSLFSALLNYF